MSDTNGVIHILHIEDEKLIATTIERILRRTFKAVVTTAVSGPEALAAIEQNPNKWAAILSDWNIKGKMSGGDVFRQVADSYPDLAKRYVFMSDDQEAERLAAASGVSFIEKPARAATICTALLPMIKDALASKS